MGDQKSKEYANEDLTDLAALWVDASREYYTITGLDVRRMKKFNNIGEVLKDTEVQDNFAKFRHNKGNVDKLRSFIARNSELIMKGAEAIADAASTAFPPSTAIVSALAYIMKASKDISKDYDMIAAFFEETNTLLERLTPLEKRLPSWEGFRSHLMRVFSAIMKLYAFAYKAAVEGRLKRFAKTVFRGGGDDELASASAKLDTELRRLESATGFVTLANTQDIKQDTTTIREGQTQSLLVLDEIKLAMGVSQSEILRMSQQFSRMMASQLQAANRQQESEPGSDQGLQKPAAFYMVQRAFLGTVAPFYSPEDDPAIQHSELEYTLVDGTTQWLFEDEQFEEWKNGTSESPLLWLTGDAGIGKSCLAYSAIQELRRSTASRSETSVAYYYFRDESWETDEMQYHQALSHIIPQIAQLDPSYCTQVAADLAQVNGLTNWDDDVWDKYIVSNFKSDGESCLFLVLDAVDYVCVTLQSLLDALRLTVSKKPNVRILLVSRPGWKDHLDSINCSYSSIVVSKEKVTSDMRLVVDARMKTYSRLHRFRQQVQTKIASDVLAKADSMLYVQYVMTRLNKMYQEKAVLQAASDLPSTVSDLYEVMMSEIQSRKTKAEIGSLQSLFKWLAFCKRPLRAGDANRLAKLCGDSLFSIDEEVSGRTGTVLEMSGFELDDIRLEHGEDDLTASAPDSDIATPGTLEDGDPSTVRFQDRFLRDYFNTLNVSSSDQTSPNTTHIWMFEMTVKIICGMFGEQKAGPGLTNYACTFWAKHFLDINVDKASDAEVLQVLSLMRLPLTNYNNVSRVLEANIDNDLLPYMEIIGSNEDCSPVLTRLSKWFERARAMEKSKFGAETYEWIQTSFANPMKVMVPLARGHVENWLQGAEDDRIVRAYGFAADALSRTNLCPDPNQLIVAKDEAETIFIVAGVFDDIQADRTRHRALAVALQINDPPHLEEAAMVLEEGLSMCKCPFDRFKLLAQLSTVAFKAAIAKENKEWEEIPTDIAMTSQEANTGEEYFSENEEYEEDDEGDEDDECEEGASLKEYEDPRITAARKALENVDRALKNNPQLESKELALLARDCLFIRATCQRMLALHDEAVQSVEEARRIHPEEIPEGECLGILPGVLAVSTQRETEMIEKLKGWNLFERMAWLSLGFNKSEDLDYDPLEVFEKAAKNSHQELFVIETYEQMIALLGRRDGSSFMQDRLANFYVKVYGEDLEKAKGLLYQILDPNAKNADLATPTLARQTLSSVLYEQFRTAPDPELKNKYMREMAELQDQPIMSRYQESVELSTSIVYANMLRKMGSTQAFQEVLDHAFEFCIKALTDKEAWNDQNSLRLLAKVLASVGGLEREAQIALSAQFSVIDPSVKHGVDPDAWETEEDDDEPDLEGEDPKAQHITNGDNTHHQSEEPEDRVTSQGIHLSAKYGEVDPTTMYPCAGCGKLFEYASVVYLCLMCPNTDLCHACYTELQNHNKGAPWEFWRKYCGKNHRYIKAPVDGWGGVQDGFMVIDGEKKGRFVDWIAWLKDTRWKQAWEHYWKREDGVVDIL